MALPFRQRAVPQCTACLRSYAFAESATTATPVSVNRQQVRGKKRMPNNSAIVTVRLLKPVKTFGKKGSIVPISRGQMRNYWFPSSIAEYVPAPELRTLRANGVAVERDFEFGTTVFARPDTKDTQQDDANRMSDTELQSASFFQKPTELEPLTPERSRELVDIFIPPRLDFYRQPIIEEKQPEEPKKTPRYGGGAAADLLAARQSGPTSFRAGPQAIYGSVSTHDVLAALRAAMANNDESARVVLHEDDISFVELPKAEGAEAGKVKHVGDFTVEIAVRGSETLVRRTVKVIPQEL